MRLLAFLTLFALAGCSRSTRAKAQTATPTPECVTLRAQGRLADAQRCFDKLVSSSSPYLRAEGLWGLERFQEANTQFRAAVKADANNPHIRVRWGRLFLERFNAAEAAKLFGEALEMDPNFAEAHLGNALAVDSFDEKAVEFAERALKEDPKLVEAQALLARLALEGDNQPRAAEEANKALAMDPKSLDAMAVHYTLDVLNYKPDSPWRAKALAVHPQYGEVHSLAGRLLVFNRRYEEGIEQYRQALALSPKLDEARSELGIQLMRLGRDEEARKLLEESYERGYKNAATVNSLRLLESYRNFETYRTPTTVVKLHKKEAALLRPYVESELQRAISTYEKKYKIKLPGPVQVEVYPDHEDFAVRTMGLPGLGALGVTFGAVVAMDSPSGRPPGSFHWATTLWHELSHVFVLTATQHRVPRWFTEGMAVHEETAVAPDWGDRLDPGVIRAIKEKKLLPIAELDRGFLRPRYPNQVIVSYFQAGRVCDFINEKWGYDKLLAMMHAFGKGTRTPDVVQQQLGVAPEEFDRRFLTWLDGKVGTTVSSFDAWSKGRSAAMAAARTQKHDETISAALAVRDLYPDFVEGSSLYELLADAYVAKGDKPKAIEQLEEYAARGGRQPRTLAQLADLQQEAGRPQDAAKTYKRLSYIYLGDDKPHRRLGEIALQAGDTGLAIREFEAVVALKPVDLAQAHYDLARAYHAAKRTKEATEHVLESLEAAPGFKPAQKLLLDLNRGGSSD